MTRVLIAGCGYVGSALGERLVMDSQDVWGVRRKAGPLPLGVRAFPADLCMPGSLQDLPGDLDYVFYMAAPAGSADPLYRAAYVDGLRTLLAVLDQQKQAPQRVFFVSSTAVYAQRDGDWVDETSPTEPTYFSGVRLLEAEKVLFESPFAGTVVRFGGIYGPRRTRLIDRVRTGAAEYHVDPPRYTNRIHRDDCAGVLQHLMGVEKLEKLYVGVDCDPADDRGVLAWLSGVLGAPAPRAAGDSEPTSSRGSSNKRCSNARLLGTGYSFRYPTFREGYAAVLEDLV